MSGKHKRKKRKKKDEEEGRKGRRDFERKICWQFKVGERRRFKFNVCGHQRLSKD
jgi:hypothetical protein